MPHQILTDIVASISELKASPMKVVASGEGMHEESVKVCLDDL